MPNFFLLFPTRSRWVVLSAAVLLAALRFPAAAQGPAWQAARTVAAAAASSASNAAGVDATAVDAAGNVYVAGYFAQTVTLGTTTLTSAGSGDIFVAKFNPVTNQFVWAQRAGGTGNDYATALAVSGSSVYVAGQFESPTAAFGSATLTSAGAADGFVAKLTDAGSTSSFTWAQRAGGGGTDYVAALAVSGSGVYVAGAFSSLTLGIGPATLSSAGGYDAFVAKLTDAGSTSTLAWAQRAGGPDADGANALAVSGSAVYVAGSFAGTTAAFGATTLASAGAADAFVAKLTDAGSSSFAWAQRAGGAGRDVASALAVSGSRVYVAGSFADGTAGGTAAFGPSTLTSAGAYDLFVATLADAGSTSSFAWAQRAGGIFEDRALALAASGTSVYVAGYYSSPSAAFGASTLPGAGYDDVFVAKLTDAGSTGSFAWAQRASSVGIERATALAVSGSNVYVGGFFQSGSVTFGTSTVSSPNSNTPLAFLASLSDGTLTATAAGRSGAAAHLFPNPTRGMATLRLPIGTVPGPLVLTDAQGRTVRRYLTPTAAEAILDLRDLPAGLYWLRGAGLAQRLALE